jgi:hypothetical protein
MCANACMFILKSLYLHHEKRKQLQLKIHCGVEQLAARWAHNPKVVSSSLAPATKKPGEKSSGFFMLVIF